MPHRPQTQKKPPPQDQHRWYPYAPASAGVWCEEPQSLQPGHGDCQRGAPLRRPQTQKTWRQPQRETRFFIHLFDLLVFHVISHIDHILPTIFLTITPGAGGQMAETTIKAVVWHCHCGLSVPASGRQEGDKARKTLEYLPVAALL